MVYLGHGQNDGYGWENWNTNGESLKIGNIQTLSNGDSTPVVFNIACNCSNISKDTCLSEARIASTPGAQLPASAPPTSL